MRKELLIASFLVYNIAAGYASFTLPPNLLRCRSCKRASDLSDCNHLKICDKTLQECYMEQVVTDTQSIVYNGGCRSKQVCAIASGSTPVGKKREMITCSRCCNTADDCNKRLCGLQEPSTNSVQCYHCDHRTSSQSEVKDPERCVTLGYCQPNEKCYVSQHDYHGVDTFFYGCLHTRVCEIVMKAAYQDYLVCVANKTQTVSNADRDRICGKIQKRQIGTFLCTSCCGDNGCNYGTCKELRGSVILSLFMDGTVECKLPFTTPSTGFNLAEFNI